MGISMSLDLSSATLAELAALVDAAQAAGVSPDTELKVAGDTLSLEFGDVVRPEVVDAEPVTPSGADAVRDTVRQVLSEEAVRGLFDTLITKNSQRRP
ncbi:hypothetical protein CKALI_03900 [Corynebacterium kalinowskii]|uniref:Uncharacterized protein n=1 Tax=Corynebacterium kalinowskii TaxID=2675216 RepID=A0A6B8VF36_9CORY|nr:hypothetical protein [Corynebacterium kalinowskii]QGU01659.1 hypothetical protein CKALI_03900 [Corynebacterium kalinowskii]